MLKYNRLVTFSTVISSVSPILESKHPLFVSWQIKEELEKEKASLASSNEEVSNLAFQLKEKARFVEELEGKQKDTEAKLEYTEKKKQSR